MILSRRRALFGFLAAPAIVAAPSLMRVSTMPAALCDYEAANAVMQRYAGFDVLVTTTLRKHAAEIAKNVQANNAIWDFLVGRSA